MGLLRVRRAMSPAHALPCTAVLHSSQLPGMRSAGPPAVQLWLFTAPRLQEMRLPNSILLMGCGADQANWRSSFQLLTATLSAFE